jgi:hypothetical protein
MENEHEIWLIVPGYPGYEASTLGRVRRCVASQTAPVGFIMKAMPDRWGYMKITLHHLGTPRCTQVHRVVAETFHGLPPSARHQVAHWDGDKSNNRASNLRWVTARENAQDRDRHGRHTGIQGERHHAAKLTNAQVVEIRGRAEQGARGCDLAAEYGVSPTTVCGITRGKAWLKVPNHPGPLIR